MSKRINFYGLYFFDRKNSAGATAMLQNEQSAEKFISHLLENFKKEKFIHHFMTIFGAVI